MLDLPLHLRQARIDRERGIIRISETRLQRTGALLEVPVVQSWHRMKPNKHERFAVRSRFGRRQINLPHEGMHNRCRAVWYSPKDLRAAANHLDRVQARLDAGEQIDHFEPIRGTGLLVRKAADGRVRLVQQRRCIFLSGADSNNPAGGRRPFGSLTDPTAPSST